MEFGLLQSGIVGRDGVLSACESALDCPLGGRGGLLLITGEPGISKTHRASSGGGDSARPQLHRCVGGVS